MNTLPLVAAKFLPKCGGWVAYYHGVYVIDRKTRAFVNYANETEAFKAAQKAAAAFEKRQAAR